jgi:hypothetical protein
MHCAANALDRLTFGYRRVLVSCVTAGPPSPPRPAQRFISAWTRSMDAATKALDCGVRASTPFASPERPSMAPLASRGGAAGACASAISPHPRSVPWQTYYGNSPCSVAPLSRIHSALHAPLMVGSWGLYLAWSMFQTDLGAIPFAFRGPLARSRCSLSSTATPQREVRCTSAMPRLRDVSRVHRIQVTIPPIVEVEHEPVLAASNNLRRPSRNAVVGPQNLVAQPQSILLFSVLGLTNGTLALLLSPSWRNYLRMMYYASLK